MSRESAGWFKYKSCFEYLINTFQLYRAHRNDLENCLPFLIIGFFFVLTNPAATIAINLIRVAVLARIVHTIAYAVFATQPTRGISWGVCYAITIYMAVKTALFFC